MELEIDLPLLHSVKMGDYAFRRTRSFAMSNLTSLQSIDFGQGCFGGHSEIYYYDGRSYTRYVGGAQSFALRGNYNGMKWWIDLPQLHSVKLGEGAFLVATRFEISNIPSIRSIETGSSCFSGYYDWEWRELVGGASSFSLISRSKELNDE